VIIGVAAMFAMVMGYLLNSKKMAFPLIMIATDTLQVLALFASTRVSWPPLVEQILLIMSALNLNIELLSPECLIPEIDFLAKFLAMQAVPVVVLVLAGMLVLVRSLLKCMCTSKDKKHRWSHVPTIVSSLVILGRVA